MELQPIIEQLAQYGALGLVIVYLIRENNVLQNRIDTKNTVIDTLQRERINDWRYFSEQRAIRWINAEGDTDPFGRKPRITMPVEPEFVQPMPPPPGQRP